MALNAPPPLEVEQIQFKIHDKFQIFQSSNVLRNNINLLATSSTNGLVFIGNPYKGEIVVTQLKTLVETRDGDGKLYARVIQIPAKPNCIATSCDGQYLAVNYTLNNCGFLAIYSVPSFYEANVTQSFQIRISPDDNVEVNQILWNPIISPTLAIVMSDGSVGMYNLKDNTYEFHSLDKSQQVLCGCWSPKGKQIAFGFRAGKIVQFKPDLKPARTIECLSGVVDGSFKTIAVQWLSTYQFAAAYLQDGDDMTANLFIVNAPKTGHPTYINYYDICYSTSGPRIPQVFFMYVQPWNMLLVANSNSMEIGILGTLENGEAPNWTEYNINDSCRLSLPMTKDKLETYPIGFCLETGSSHQLIIGESEIPIMPMIHVLSTHGQLISFDFLNLYPNAPSICSPFSHSNEQPGLIHFKELLQEADDGTKLQNISDAANTNKTSDNNTNFETVAQTPAVQTNFFTQSQPSPQPAFSLGGSVQPLFGSNLPLNSGTSLFGNSEIKFGNGNVLGSLNQQTQQAHVPSGLIGNQSKAPPLFGSVKSMPVMPNMESNTFAVTSTTDKISENPDKNKPLYTVQPVFITSNSEKPLENINETNKIQDISAINEKSITKDSLNYDYIQEMIQTEIQCFELELKELSFKSKDINISIGNMENIKNYTKRLEKFHEIINKEKDNETEAEIQGLRNSINECFTMIAEVKSKLEFFENPQLSKMTLVPSNDQASRRQLARLNSTLATNKAHLKIIKQKIDANWSDFQDLVQRNSSTKMHIPSLEGIYQTMTKQKNILAKERQKIAHLKSKLNFPGQQFKQFSNKKNDINPDSLADSILSLNLSEQISKENSKLNNNKLETIRTALQNRKIIKIVPQRPDRLQSEVILRSKIRTKEMNKMQSEKNFPSATSQTSFIKKTEDSVFQNPTTLSKDTVVLKMQPAENVSQINSASFNSKTQSVSTPTLFNSTLIGAKSLPNNVDGVSFGNMGLSLTKPSVLTPENKNSSTISSLLLSKSQNPTTPSNSSAAIAKPFGGGSGVFSSSSGNTPILSFGNMSNTIVPSLAFGNIPNKGSFTPVSSVQPFNTNTSGLTFNVKTTNVSQSTVKAQVPTVQNNTISKPALVFSQNTSSDSSQPENVSSLASNTDSNKNLDTQIQSEKQISTDSFLENLSICKPTAKTSTTPQNINIFGSGVFTLNPQNSNQSVTISETKTNFLNTFSSTSKSTLFGTTPISFNTSSAQIPFVFAQPTISSTANMESIGNKSSSSLTTISETTKPLFNISKSPSILSFGSTQTSATAQVEAPIAIKSDPPATNTRLISNDVPQHGESVEKPTTNTAISPVNLTLDSISSKISETSFGKEKISESSESEKKPVSATVSFGTTNISTASAVALPSVVSTSTTTVAFPNSSVAPASSTNFSFTFDSLENLSTTTAANISDQAAAVAPRGSITFGTAPPSAGNQFSTNTSISQPNQNFNVVSAVSSANISQSTAGTATNTIFGGIPKPDQSVFSQPSSFGNIFSQTAPTAQFGQKNSPSIFGGSSSLGAGQKTSAFGSSTTQNLNTGFTNTAEQKTDNTQNIFGSPSNTATNSGSIFSRSPFSLNSNTVDQENATTIFGNSPSGNLAFGGGSGGFIFGGSSSNANQAASTSPFTGGGSFSSGAAGNTTAFEGFGTNQSGIPFGQPGSSSSQSQTSFASPNSTLQKPTFGGPPTFGSPPTFGNSPTFGGNAMFGSGVKGFGNFSTPTNSNQTGSIFGSPTQKSEYFEALGSSNDGLSFGNLAQNANTNSTKPNFVAGSSFSSWR
ncbi:nuclear pore complex protein Nup214 [Condylostylus longicornis]|uniref:nuclear pore complex protein Nup214 n=1 Tax=Condylostylus longicornis TaxID=2530218 RepID=UPI00244DBA5B|nr:nuclear pore complex protein Nup214 [Condylostylus longicornis]